MGPRALQAYAAAEGGAALCGVALALVLPNLVLTPRWSPGPEGWLWPADLGLRVLVVVALVGPPAVLMGTTLPLALKRALPGPPATRGWRIGVMLAANTFGAAAGALATDLWLVPAVGVLGTQLVAVGLSAAAGVAALAVHAGWPASARPPEPALPAPPERAEPTESALTLPTAAAAVFLSGLCLLTLEVVWFRFLGSALGHFRAVLALSLAAVLVGLWLGDTAAGALSRRFAPRHLFAWSQGLGVVLTVAALLHHDPEDVLRAQLDLPPLLANLLPMMLLVLPASAALGAGLPLAVAAARPVDAEVGRAAGRLLAAGALGNLVGAVATGLWWLPTLGMQGSALVALCAALLAGLIVVAAGARRERFWAVAPLASAAVAVAVFASQPPDRLLWASFPHQRAQAEGVLAVAEGREHTIVVTGDPAGPARLWTSGHPMASTTVHAQRYMRLLAHLPLLLQEDPERALVICFGVGNTAHAASLHPSLTDIDVADLSADVLRHAGWFSHANRDVLGDPRVHVIVDDGRRVLQAPGEPWDLVTLEPPPIGYAGVSALYSRELYLQARARLTPTGCLSQWAPLYQVSADAQLALIAAFAEVFPDGALFVADRRELVLVGCRDEAPQASFQALQARLDRRPAVAADLAAVDIEGIGGIVERFGRTHLSEVSSTPPVTLDRPLLESDQTSQVTVTRMPRELFDPLGIAAWCNDCPVPAARYDDETFLQYSNLPVR